MKENASIEIRVNDESKSIAENSSLQNLIEQLELSKKKGLAVAINEKVIPQSSWVEKVLANGDRILIITATQGG